MSAFNFSIEITPDGASAPLCGASFSECDGLEMTIEAKTIREGGNNGVQRGARLRPAKAAVAGKAMVVSTNRAALANRGGFGSSTKSSGVGRSTASSKGGFGGGGGRSGGG